MMYMKKILVLHGIDILRKMNQMNAMQKKWVPDMQVSKGAESYHKAVIEASWNVDNIQEITLTVHRH